MPFNSSQNYLDADYSVEESMKILQTSFNLPPDYASVLPNQQMSMRAEINQPYIRSANIHSSLNYYNADELKYLNSHQRDRGSNMEGSGMGSRFKTLPHNPMPRTPMPRPRRRKQDEDVLVGEGIGKLIKKAKRTVNKGVSNTVNKGVNNVVNVAKKQVVKGVNDGVNHIDNNLKQTKTGLIKTGNAIKRSATREDGFLHQAIEKVNDHAIPMAGEALGSAAGTALGTAIGNPALGAAVGAKVGRAAGQIARKELNKKTGYGVAKGVGKYKKNVNLDKIIDKYVPALKSGEIKSVSSRAQVVKQVMKETGLSLPQASKYVKENNLWKK